MKILIIDDSNIVRKRTVRLLKEIKREINVVEIRTFDSIETILYEKPDFILIDIRVKNIAHVDIIKSIKSNLPECKVLVYTNAATSFLRKKCITNGADYFFDKSNEFEAMIKQIDKLCMKPDIIVEA